MNYKDFYRSFNLEDFPFQTFTTEQELNIANRIFVPQGEYDPIIDAFKAERTIIIQGERGSGKTAIMEDFKRYLGTSKQKIFTVINDYSSLSSPPSSAEIYRLIISNVLVEVLSKLKKNSFRLMLLNREDKVFLSYLVSTYLPSYSQNTLKDRISKIQTPYWNSFLSWIYNRFRQPMNYIATAGLNLTYQYILRQFAFLPVLHKNDQIQSFFPELKLNVEFSFFTNDISFGLLKKVCEITERLGFKKPVVFFDKFDEDARLENDAERISVFLIPFLTDSNLLCIDNMQLIYFVWSTPFRFIHDIVRTQKYYCPSLKWSRNDLEKLLNKRLSEFSNNKVQNYLQLFQQLVDKESINFRTPDLS